MYKIIIPLLLIMFSCNNNYNKSDNKIIVVQSNHSQFVEINTIGSEKTMISIRNGKIEYINKFNNGKLNGEQLKFHSNGKLSSKSDVLNGLSKGYCYEFYPSGSIKNYTFFCNIYPCYFGVYYWDNPINTIKHSIHYGNKGQVTKIKIFDTLGYFVKDSIPQ